MNKCEICGETAACNIYDPTDSVYLCKKHTEEFETKHAAAVSALGVCEFEQQGISGGTELIRNVLIQMGITRFAQPANRKTVKIEIDSTFMNTVGSATLYGTVHSLGVKKGDLAILIFHQSSDAWRETHHGPDAWIMPEFSVMEFIRDVILLNKEGISIDVCEKTVNPK